MSKATFTFGRFNVPTEEGHGKLISAVQSHADETGGSHYVFPSHSQDAKKNPLAHGEKVGFMRRLFPKANIVSNPGIRTAIDAVKHLESKGHTHVTMVVGSDRVAEFQGLLTKYRKKEFPGVKKISVVSAGNRDPDAEGAEGMSASKLRGLVAAGKRSEFISHYSDPKLGAQIHDRTKAGMQLESTNPVCLVLLGGPGSGKDYVLNNIFSRFDLTEVQVDHVLNGTADELIEQRKNIVVNGAIDEEKIGEISALLEGYEIDTVYVSVSNKVSRLRNSLRENPLAENKRIDKWLKAEKLAESLDQKFTFNNSINLNESSDLEKVFFANQIEKLLARLIEHGLVMKEEPKLQTFTLIREKKFPAVRKKHGMPAKYSTGLSKSTALARKRHWEKANELSDSDPRAYEPAPGDATAKTKPSKHTIAVRKMMSEGVAEKIRKHPAVQEYTNEKRWDGNINHVITLKPGYWHKDSKLTVLKPSSYSSAEEMLQKVELTPRQVNANKVADAINLNIAHKQSGHRMLGVRKHIQNEEIEALDEGKADKSLAAKAAKSGVSLSTLRKVFRRGVAAWNSGHRPGTTPSQWGHARVNSYINKGKTYHTADKDLREETDINELFEMQLVGTDEYRKHAIAMTPGQGEPVNAFSVKSPNKKIIEVPAKPGKSIVSQYTTEEESDCCGGSSLGVEEQANIRTNSRNFREFRASIKEAKSEVELPPTADVTPTLTKKRKGSNTITTPNRLVNPAVDGLPVVSRLTGESAEIKEAVNYHLENKISFTENVFRPGSEMFFEMINEAKFLYKAGMYEPTDEWEVDMLNSEIGEKAMYEGREVILDYPFEEELNEEDKTEGKGIGKPWREGGGGAVYVRDGDSIRKIRFSQSGMKKKYMDPAATRSFVARHRCLTNKDKTSASYWACRWPRFFSNSGKVWW